MIHLLIFAQNPSYESYLWNDPLFHIRFNTDQFLARRRFKYHLMTSSFTTLAAPPKTRLNVECNFCRFTFVVLFAFGHIFQSLITKDWMYLRYLQAYAPYHIFTKCICMRFIRWACPHLDNSSYIIIFTTVEIFSYSAYSISKSNYFLYKISSAWKYLPCGMITSCNSFKDCSRFACLSICKVIVRILSSYMITWYYLDLYFTCIQLSLLFIFILLYQMQYWYLQLWSNLKTEYTLEIIVSNVDCRYSLLHLKIYSQWIMHWFRQTVHLFSSHSEYGSGKYNVWYMWFCRDEYWS